ncbi:MAG: hypothetical protein ACREGC_02185 [Minisyncoccia bacterium]
MGSDFSGDDKSDEELKPLVIKKVYQDLDLSGKNQDYVDGMFEAICRIKLQRNDSLTSTRQAIESHQQNKINNAYEKWVESSAKMWQLPLAGHI